MPQQTWAGFTPDPKPTYSGFTPDPIPSIPTSSSFDPSPFGTPAGPLSIPSVPQTPPPDLSQYITNPPPTGGRNLSDLILESEGAKPKPSWYEDLWGSIGDVTPPAAQAAWKYGNDPLTNIFSRGAKGVTDLWSLSDEYAAGGKAQMPPDYKGGADILAEFVGSTLDQSTSPINLAQIAGTGGAALARNAGRNALGQGLSAVGRSAAGLSVAHGGQVMADPKSTLTERALGAVEAIGSGFDLKAPKPKPSGIPGIADTTIPSLDDIGTGAIPEGADLRLNKPAPIDQGAGPAGEASIKPPAVPNADFDLSMGSPQVVPEIPLHLRDAWESGTMTPEMMDELRALSARTQNIAAPEAPAVPIKGTVDSFVDEVMGKVKGEIPSEVPGLQAKANETGSVYSGVYPEKGVPVVHNPETGGFQHHVRGNENWVTHPMLDKPQGPFPTQEAAFDWALDFQETPAFRKHLDEWYASQEPPVVPIKPDFDPSTLKGLEPTTPPVREEIQFVDPQTGEIKPASEARPGDVPLIPEEAPAAPAAEPSPTVPAVPQNFSPEVLANARKLREQLEMAPESHPDHPGHSAWGQQFDEVDTFIQQAEAASPTTPPVKPRSATKRMGTPDLGPSIPEGSVIGEGTDLPLRPESEIVPPAPKGESFTDFIKRLAGENSGEWDTDPIFRALTRGAARVAHGLGITPPGMRTDPSSLLHGTRRFIDSMSEDELVNFVTRSVDDPAFASESGRNILNHAQDVIDARRSGVINQGDYTRAADPNADAASTVSDSVLDAVPPWNRREMDDMRSPTLARYVRAYAERDSPEARAIVEYGNALLESRANARNAARSADNLIEPETGMPADIYRGSALDDMMIAETPQTRAELPAMRERMRGDDPFEIPDRPTEELPQGREPFRSTDEMHDISTNDLEDFVYRNEHQASNPRQTAYARGILNERWNRIGADPASVAIPRPGEVPGVGSQMSGEQLRSQLADEAAKRSARQGVQSKAKTLEDLEAAKRTPAMNRLGRIIGEGRAEELVKGDKTIEYDVAPPRERGKRLSPFAKSTWDAWARDQLSSQPFDSTKPGMEVKNGTGSFPNQFGLIFRNESGKVIGVLKTDLQGRGISTLAVDPDIGLRRGTVAFDLLKKSYDRGVSEPSGIASEFTKNLIDRVKKIIQREMKRLANEPAGTADHELMFRNMINLIGRAYTSEAGKAIRGGVKKFFTDETGATEIGAATKRLQELFSKSKTNLTPDELAEAISLAREVRAAEAGGGGAGKPPVEPPATGGIPEFEEPAGPKSVKGYLEGEPAVSTGPVVEGNASPPSGEPPKKQYKGPKFGSKEYYDSLAGKPRFIGPRRAVEGPRMASGRFNSGRMQGGPEWASEFNSPQGRTPVERPMFGPHQPPRLGPRRPNRPRNTGPTVDQNPQLVQDLRNRVRTALEQKHPNAGPSDINKLMDSYENVIRDNPNLDEPGIIRQVLAANKALLTSWDLSAPGRQGKAFMLNIEFWKALPGMVRAYGSKGAADVVNQSIVNHPSGYFQKGKNAAGKETETFAEMVGLDLADVEEAFKGKISQSFEKYTAIDRSSRAHTAFLNKLRSDMFVNFMESSKAAGINPEINLEVARKYAEFINNATGRGSLNIGTKRWNLEKVSSELNDVFFSPKNLSGQIRTWNQVLNPMKYKNYDPVLRKQALRSLVAVAGMGAMATEAARLIPGVEVSHDPRSSDFMKIRIGDTRIDLFGGYQQFPVALLTVLTGSKSPIAPVSGSGKAFGNFGGSGMKFGGKDPNAPIDLSEGGFGQPTRWTEAEKFFKNRLSPAGSFVYSWMSTREFDGKPFEEKRALYERTAPIVLKDLWELAQEDPKMAAILAPLIITGFASAQTYTGRN